MNYTLNINLTPSQLQLFEQAGELIVLAKPNGPGASEPNVAWLAFNPLENNTVTWQEQYGIYASNVQLTNGAVLTQMSSVPPPAVEDALYTLADDGVITGPATGQGQPDAFSLLNEYSHQPAMTVGLFQNASANGIEILNSAVSAAIVPFPHKASMTPYTNVYIWMQASIVGNSVVTNVAGNQTELTFGGGVDTITVIYDDASGSFVPVANDSKQLVRVLKHEKQSA